MISSCLSSHARLSRCMVNWEKDRENNIGLQGCHDLDMCMAIMMDHLNIKDMLFGVRSLKGEKC